MRLLELKLNEAGLEAKEMRPEKMSNVKDKKGRLLSRSELFLQKIKNKSPFQTTDGRQIIIDPKELSKAVAWVGTGTPRGRLVLMTLDGEKIAPGNLLKTNEFGGQGEGSEDESKVANKGDIAEGILGAALFAKLAARINGTIGDITNENIWKIVYGLKQSGADEYTATVKDAGRKVVNDKIVFTLRLNPAPYNDLMNPIKRPVLEEFASSAAEFVNSPNGQEFAEHYYLNGKPDAIRIISDGVSDQKGQKTDVKVIATDLKTGEKRELELNMSLKTSGIPQFGQVGAGAIKKQGDMFRAQTFLWNEFGIDMSPVEKEFERILAEDGIIPAMKYGYQSAANILVDLLSGDYDDEEYIYIKQFAKGVNYHGTLNDPNVLLVDFSKGTYDVLNFSLLEDKLADINLTAKYTESGTGLPIVQILDAVSNKRLLQFRYYINSSGARKHLIEKGPLLSKLISVKRKK
jgi:hypothetical protein